jgi:hypothetical protein
MLNRHRLQADVEAEFAEFFGYILSCGGRLRRSGGTRANIFREVSQLAVSVVVIERRSLDRRKLLQ